MQDLKYIQRALVEIWSAKAKKKKEKLAFLILFMSFSLSERAEVHEGQKATTPSHPKKTTKNQKKV